MTTRPFFARFAPWVLLGIALATPLIFVGAARAVKSNSNKVADWLPATFPETKQFVWFREHFVADQFVLISWEGCRLGGDPNDPTSEPDDPRIEQLAQILVPEEGTEPKHADQRANYFKSVTTARRVLEELTNGPSKVPYDEAAQRLKGALIGPDGRQTCVVVTLTDEAVGNLREAVGRGHRGPIFGIGRDSGLLYDLFAECGIKADEVHCGGPPIDNVAIDEEGERTLIRLAGLSGLLGLGLAWWSLRSIKLTAIVFACGILAAALGLAFVWVTGEKMDAVLLSMPSLVYVLAISGAVHIVNYYREAVAEGGLVGAPERAVAHAWKPAFLCELTTAIGLASLYTSELEPIRKFGIYSAAAVMMLLGVLFAFLPAALQIWPIHPNPKAQAKRKSSVNHGAAPSHGYTIWLDRLWGGLGGWVTRHHALTMVLCMAVICMAGYGLTRVRTSIDLLKLFDSSARILADYEWLENRLGQLIPMEVVLRFPSDTQRQDMATPASQATSPPRIDASQLSILERMETVAFVQQAIDQHFGREGRGIVGPTMSAATFGPALPGGGGSTANYLRRTTTSQRLEESRERLENTGYLRRDPSDGSELWRVSLRVAAFEGVDYGQFVDELRKTIDPIVAVHAVREDVIRTIAARQADGNVTGAKVLLWDSAPSASAQVTTVSAPAVTSDSAAIVDTLAEFLKRKRLRVARISADPTTVPITQLKKLREFDCVVLTGDFSPADVEMIRNEQVSVVSMPAPDATHLPAVAADSSAGQNAEIAAVYTGVVPIVYKAQRVLLNSLIESTFWSLITITPLMMYICRGVYAGFIVMIPNTLPILVIFGGMGWLGIAVDIGSMMTASIALGVAVDDTIHFLAWYREDLNNLRDRRKAILACYQRCATPTLQAALISGLGLSVFAFSTFTPTQRFGWLMLTILAAGVIAELVMLPALLAGPLGRVFRIPPAPEQDRSPADIPSRQDTAPVIAAPHFIPAPSTSAQVAEQLT